MRCERKGRRSKQGKQKKKRKKIKKRDERTGDVEGLIMTGDGWAFLQSR